MPGIEVNEPLNPSAWTTEQQQEVYDALAELLDIPPVGPDYPSMTDEELTEALHAVIDEIKTRPAAVVTRLDNIVFGSDVIQQESNDG